MHFLPPLTIKGTVFRDKNLSPLVLGSFLCAENPVYCVYQTKCCRLDKILFLYLKESFVAKAVFGHEKDEGMKGLILVEGTFSKA